MPQAERDVLQKYVPKFWLEETETRPRLEWHNRLLHHHHFASKAGGARFRMVGTLVQEHRNTYRVKTGK